MDPDKYQQAWRAQSSQTRLTVDANLLLKEVERNRRDFRALIFRRDVLEIGVALLMLPYWFYAGIKHALPWTWYLEVPALVWVAGFMLFYRFRHRQKPSQSDEPLLRCVERSLTDVENQIWLLRNVFWWYLLPFVFPMLAFFVQVSWQAFHDWLPALAFGGSLFVFVLVINAFLYYVNQRAVRLRLEPRRQELLALRASLGDESTTDLPTLADEQAPKSSRKLRRWLIVVLLSCVALVVIAKAVGPFGADYDQPAKIDGPAGDALGRLVTDLRKEKKLVGLAAMVMIDGQVEAVVTQGERKKGSGVPLGINDRWHLGGITKSITATMIAQLVESGRMQWSDTIVQAFPEAALHDDWKSVTLLQLLTDTADAPANFATEVRYQHPAIGRECTAARRSVVLNVLADQPAYPPGKKHLYSNVGYTIVAAMAEQVTGETWEDLVKSEVFEPLGLTESGFGPPTSADATLEQPRGHRPLLGWKVGVDDKADNTPIMGPSGNIHMTLRDLCTFANEHLRGELGNGKLLTAETYQLLHTPALDNYACGWVRNASSGGVPSTMFWHNGTNTMWYALVEFIPEQKLVVAVTSNDGDYQQAEGAALKVLQASVNRFQGEGAVAGRKPQGGEVFPKKSPFAAVAWQGSQPQVKIGDEWYQLVSIDDVSAAEIVAFSRRIYGNKWRMRFEEDLVELLSRMGHPPHDTVKLTVQSRAALEPQVLDDVPMTTANRDAIKAAAQNRAETEP